MQSERIEELAQTAVFEINQSVPMPWLQIR